MLNKKDQQWVQETIGKITSKMDWVCEKSQDKIPYTTVDGVHSDKLTQGSNENADGPSWWTNGFFAGMNWLMYHETKDKKYARIARKTEVALDETFDYYYGLHHDTGFMWLPSSVTNYRLTGDMDGRRRGMHAANLLAGRFNPVGKFIRAWNDFSDNDTRGWAIIDCMFNIPLLYWATEETGDPRFKQIAEMHATTVKDNFIRENGSSEHIVEFDPFKGGKVDTYRGQGYAKGSAWTRGQSWALYGFVMSYKHTQNPAFLETACKVADYFVSQIPESGLIPVDFDQPSEPALEDSTAAAIASCGLIELSGLVDGEDSEKYLMNAVKMLKTLSEKRCDWSDGCDAIVENCSGQYHEKQHHYSIIYGDFYFMEALFKLKGNDHYMW